MRKAILHYTTLFGWDRYLKIPIRLRLRLVNQYIARRNSSDNLLRGFYV